MKQVASSGEAGEKYCHLGDIHCKDRTGAGFCPMANIRVGLLI
jgi:hypothetical protein